MTGGSRGDWVRWSRLIPALFLCYGFGCLPDGALRQVLSENLLLTAALVIQSTTSTLFNSLFGFV